MLFFPSGYIEIDKKENIYLLDRLNTGYFGEKFFGEIADDAPKTSKGTKQVSQFVKTPPEQMLWIEGENEKRYYLPWNEFLLLQEVCITRPKKILFTKKEAIAPETIGLISKGDKGHEIEFIGVYE